MAKKQASSTPEKRKERLLWVLRKGTVGRSWGLSLPFYLVAIMLSLMAYVAAFIPPERFWPAGFLSYSIPVWLVFHGVMLVVFLIFKPWYSLLPMVGLLFGAAFVQRMVAWHTFSEAKSKDLKVISFNADTFGGYAKQQESSAKKAKHTLGWLAGSKADIICIQEYFDQPESNVYNVKKQLGEAGYKYSFVSRSFSSPSEATIGIATFSKFPILKHQVVYNPKGINNQILWTDILVGKRTIRVFNAHLHSLRISQTELRTNETQAAIKRNALSIFGKIRAGFHARGAQRIILEREVATSPYPVILCSDLNDLPYGYTYYRLSQWLEPSFEHAGFGLGSTYQGPIPMLRIDHQFVDRCWEVHNYQACSGVSFFDHKPIVGYYKLDTAAMRPVIEKRLEQANTLVSD